MTTRTPSNLQERDPDDASSAERTLWLSVIAQALADAVTADSNFRTARSQARAWLTGMSKDFRQVCALAGLDPSYVRAHAERLIEANPCSLAEKQTAKQHVSRRSSAGITLNHDGRTMTIAEWSRALGLPDDVIRARVRYGWTAERTLTEPVDMTRRKRSAAERNRGVGRAQAVIAGTGVLPTAQISAEIRNFQ